MKDSPVRTALLDFDGTLVHLPVDWEQLRADVSAVLRDHGFAQPLRRVYQGVAQALAEMEARGDPPAVRAALRRRVNRIMTLAEVAAAADAQALPGSHQVIAALRARGASVIIQSSNSAGVIRDVLGRLGFPPVDAIVGRESARRPKPDPAGVRSALRKLGLRGSECVVIGDGDFDVQLGRAIGAMTIRIGSGNPRADHEVTSLGEAAAILELTQRAKVPV